MPGLMGYYRGLKFAKDVLGLAVHDLNCSPTLPAAVLKPWRGFELLTPCEHKYKHKSLSILKIDLAFRKCKVRRTWILQSPRDSKCVELPVRFRSTRWYHRHIASQELCSVRGVQPHHLLYWTDRSLGHLLREYRITSIGDNEGYRKVAVNSNATQAMNLQLFEKQSMLFISVVKWFFCGL